MKNDLQKCLELSIHFCKQTLFFLDGSSWDAFQWSFLFDRLSSAFSIPTYTKSLTLPYAGKKNGNENKNKEQERGIYKVPVGSFKYI